MTNNILHDYNTMNLLHRYYQHFFLQPLKDKSDATSIKNTSHRQNKTTARLDLYDRQRLFKTKSLYFRFSSTADVAV